MTDLAERINTAKKQVESLKQQLAQAQEAKLGGYKGR
jgi:hypothetical protein